MDIVKQFKKWAEDGRIAAYDNEMNVLTFAQADRMSDALACYFIEHYDTRLPVAILCDKENEVIPCMIACIKAGKPYIVIAAFNPPKHTKKIVDDCQADILITLSPYDTVMHFPTVNLSGIHDIFAEYDGRSPDESHMMKDGDILFIMYTSGSTGIPKSVTHTYNEVEKNIANSDMKLPIHGERGWTCLNFSPYAFAFAQAQFYELLCANGVTMYGINREVSVDYDKFLPLLYKIKPRIISGTPSLLNVFFSDPDFNQRNFPDTTLFILAGENTHAKMARKIKTDFPKASLFTSFGSTETLQLSLNEVTDDLIDYADIMPIGRPEGEVRFAVISQDGSECNVNEKGNIRVISPSVSAGYRNNEALNRDVFFKDSNSGENGMLMSDMAYLAENGYYYHAGRVDNVVKVGGNRVDINEVEELLLSCEEVSACVVVPSVKDENVMFLTAFIILEHETDKTYAITSSIRKKLMEKLASYMIPRKFIIVSGFPKNINGKVDRTKIKEMARL